MIIHTIRKVLLSTTNRRNTVGGYTLLELLVVMVIVGILATQVVFMLNSATGRVLSSVRLNGLE